MIPTYSEANHAYQMGSVFSQQAGAVGVRRPPEDMPGLVPCVSLTAAETPI